MHIVCKRAESEAKVVTNWAAQHSNSEITAQQKIGNRMF